MFDTQITVIGNVLTAPEWRRTAQSGQLVANFKIASTARRLDRNTGNWVDGNSLRVRVNCWRKLAEGVAASIMVGDPVIVVGKLHTRDWIDGDGQHRVLYELEAMAVGHDLSRGRAKFARNRAAATTSAVDDEFADAHAGQEATEPAPDMPLGLEPGDPLHSEDDPAFAAQLGAVAALQGGGLTVQESDGRFDAGDHDAGDDDADEYEAGDDESAARRRRRTPVAA